MCARYSHFRAFDPDPDAPDQICDMPGCMNAAGYRAPRSPKALNQYYWFCLNHIKIYNKNWDYYRGMSPAQIEAHLRSATVWDKPSWKLGHLGGASLFDKENMHDHFDIFADTPKYHKKFNKEKQQHYVPPPNLREPLDTLGLSWPVSLDELRKRYTALARQHHPDTNGGDPESEEHFKVISSAYALLRDHLRNLPSS